MTMNKYDEAPEIKDKSQSGNETNSNLSNMFGVMTSSLYVLGVKLKGFHWNIVGDQFFPLHKLLDCQVDELFEFADGAAEIIRQLDINSPAPINMLTMIKRSFIDEARSASLVTADDIVPIIVADYSEVINYCDQIVKTADANNRQDLSDFAIGVRQYLNKYKWQFESSAK